MHQKRYLIFASILIGVISIITIFIVKKNATNPREKSEHQEEVEDFERGPHKGRLLRDGDFSLEITIFENNSPPRFHLYAYEKDKPLAPSAVQAKIQLTRLDSEVNSSSFKPKGDYLEGDAIVAEPHSFDVHVEAEYENKTHIWRYDSYEGRTTIPKEAAQAAEIETEVAGPLPIRDVLQVQARIVLNQDKSARVSAHYSGIIKAINKSIGDQVKKGEVLAVIEASDSLQKYELTSPLSGRVIYREGSIGEMTSEAPLFIVADLTSLWAELMLFPQDLERIKPGQRVAVRALSGSQVETSKIALVGSVAHETNQATIGRVVLQNTNGAWQVGMSAMAEIVVNERMAPVAVRSTGLQRFRDFTVVFAQVDDTYEVRMLELGADDGTNVEVLSGLKPGIAYVTKNSFLIKADIEKSGATHDH